MVRKGLKINLLYWFGNFVFFFCHYRGPNVSEQSFSACVNRQQEYIREATQCNEIDFVSCIHDLKLLLLSFSFGKSFHESNMNYVPYSLFYAIYLLLSSNTTSYEEKKLTDFLNERYRRNWISSAYSLESPYYFMVSSLALKPLQHWQQQRLYYLKRLIVISNVRHFSPNEQKDTLEECQQICLDFNIYKPYLLGWSLVDLIYTYFETVKIDDSENDWPMKVFNYIRNNDNNLLKTSQRIITTMKEDLLPCASFEEFCDITGSDF